MASAQSPPGFRSRRDLMTRAAVYSTYPSPDQLRHAVRGEKAWTVISRPQTDLRNQGCLTKSFPSRTERHDPCLQSSLTPESHLFKQYPRSAFRLGEGYLQDTDLQKARRHELWPAQKIRRRDGENHQDPPRPPAASEAVRPCNDSMTEERRESPRKEA